MNDALNLVHELNEEQLIQLHNLYQLQWWSRGRTLEDVRTMVDGSSLVFALVAADSGRLVAFCRVLTDFAFRGMLHDVMVEEQARCHGVGRRLMEAVTTHPRLRRVEAIGLWCKAELVPLYQKFGFEQANANYCWMQRQGPDYTGPVGLR